MIVTAGKDIRRHVDFSLPVSGDLPPAFARGGFVVCPDVVRPGRAREWRQRAVDIARRCARQIEQQTEAHLLRYRVVTGDLIATEWPELFAFYQSAELREWVAAIAGVPTTFPSPHLQSAINVNVMGEPGDIYRWHTDASGFTLLLYLSDSHEADGGSLEIRAPDGRGTTAMVPAAGTVVLMDGTRCLHRVSPVMRRHERISIPMVFTPTEAHERPTGLDDYLYSAPGQP